MRYLPIFLDSHTGPVLLDGAGDLVVGAPVPDQAQDRHLGVGQVGTVGRPHVGPEVAHGAQG